MELSPELKEKYLSHMEYCISLAKRAIPDTTRGYVQRPFIGRPYVGAIVLDKDGKIIGEGYKSFLGGTSLLQHAERMALDSFTIVGQAATLISTLQPCMKKSRGQIFDSCSTLIIKKGIRTVVFGARDDFSFDYNSTVNYLRSHGVKLIELKEIGPKIREELMDVEIFPRRKSCPLETLIE